jgi:hypothetical protein
LLISTMLSACASPPKVQTTEAACKILRPIDFYLCTDGLPETDANQCDTKPTVLAVDAYNRDLAALCPRPE